MTDPVSRLLEAIGETERLALIAKDNTEGEWGPSTWGVAATSIVLYDKSGRLAVGSVSHIERHDPSSVLRRCAVDRKILELHKPKVYETDEWNESRVLVDVEYPYCPRCWAAADYPAHSNPPERYPCDHVRLLAEAYGLEVTE